MKNKPLSLNGQMRRLRKEKHISISGSKDKLSLSNNGYFHGYKGYRFSNNCPNLPIPFTQYREITALIDYDNALKSLFYPKLMFIETAIRNRCVNAAVYRAGVEGFNDVFESVLTDYKSSSAYSGKTYATQTRNKFRVGVYSKTSQAFHDGNAMITHYYNTNQLVPFWAAAELLTMGELSYLYICLDKNLREEVSKGMGINVAFDSDRDFIFLALQTLKDLRNSVAHNNAIFDARFPIKAPSRSLKGLLSSETRITGIDFSRIEDYIILVVFLLKHLGEPRTGLLKFVSDYEQSVFAFSVKVAAPVFNSLFQQNSSNKMIALKAYIRL
jgi:abortive infection bacteriophage resistance protein